MKLVLSGGGDENDSHLHHEVFAAWIEGGATLLYLPGDACAATDSYQWIRATLAPFGVAAIEMWGDAADYDPDGLGAFGGIYIGGGNTFRMLTALRTKDMEPALRRFIEAGGPVFGGSAGAILLGRDIRSGAHRDPNDVGLSDTTGLRVVGGFTIWCHYEPSNDPLVRQLVAAIPGPILALSARAGIVVAGTEMIALGYDGVVRFTPQGRERVAPGASCWPALPTRSPTVPTKGMKRHEPRGLIG